MTTSRIATLLLPVLLTLLPLEAHAGACGCRDLDALLARQHDAVIAAGAFAAIKEPLDPLERRGRLGNKPDLDEIVRLYQAFYPGGLSLLQAGVDHTQAQDFKPERIWATLMGRSAPGLKTLASRNARCRPGPSTGTVVTYEPAGLKDREAIAPNGLWQTVSRFKSPEVNARLCAMRPEHERQIRAFADATYCAEMAERVLAHEKVHEAQCLREGFNQFEETLGLPSRAAAAEEEAYSQDVARLNELIVEALRGASFEATGEVTLEYLSDSGSEGGKYVARMAWTRATSVDVESFPEMGVYRVTSKFEGVADFAILRNPDSYKSCALRRQEPQRLTIDGTVSLDNFYGSWLINMASFVAREQVMHEFKCPGDSDSGDSWDTSPGNPVVFSLGNKPIAFVPRVKSGLIPISNTAAAYADVCTRAEAPLSVASIATETLSILDDHRFVLRLGCR